MSNDLASRSLAYHANPQPGKLKILPSKPCTTQDDLSLAYTPGVAVPCTEIHDHPEKIWEYTGRGNTVAVVSDGTAVLGLGNIGPEAGLPVMEGKSVLFKRFADIDAVALCIGGVFKEDGRTDPDKVIETVARLEPSFGGINLEDIGAPACFAIEPALKKAMKIPEKIGDCRFVMNGAGAAGIACAEYYVSAGADRSKFILCDSKGVIHDGRTDLNPQKQRFAAHTDARTLADAIKGADVFVGVSVPKALTGDMVRTMAPGAVVFAMANPTPEIFPDEALAAGAAVAGTGRSDYSNQVNNVLGFPGIFRGALDTRASDINEAMKLAASRALADIVAEPMPEDIRQLLSAAYERHLRGRDPAEGVVRDSEAVRSARRAPCGAQGRRSRHGLRRGADQDRRPRRLRTRRGRPHRPQQQTVKTEV